MRDPLCRCPDDQGLSVVLEGLLLPDDAAIIIQSAAAERPLWAGRPLT